MNIPIFMVIGEQCLDQFVYGSSERLCPEAPVPVFVPSETKTSMGMASNVLSNLQSLLRKEKISNIIFNEFCQHGIIKTRYVDKKSNHIFLRVDVGDKDVNRLSFGNDFCRHLKDSEIILISDYNKGFLTEDDILKISKLKSENAKIFLDTKKILSIDLIESVDFIKMNSVEYQNNVKYFGKSLDKYKNKIIVTLGGDGAMYDDVKYPVETSQTIDVSGAGDTFLASLAYYYAVGNTIKDSINFANQMASKVVTKRGVSII